MRTWVTHPLKKAKMIEERLDAVQELADDNGGSLSSIAAKNVPPFPSLLLIQIALAQCGVFIRCMSD